MFYFKILFFFGVCCVLNGHFLKASGNLRRNFILIIAEVERKWISIIKEVLTNRIIAYLKFRHVSL